MQIVKHRHRQGIFNRRGDEKALDLLIEIIFFIVLLFIVAFPIIQKFFSKPTVGEKKSLDTLSIEINNLAGYDQISAPIYLEKLVIKGYKENGPIEKDCRKASCICLCYDDGCKKIEECRKLDFTLQSDTLIKAGQKAKQCLLKREDKVVTISGC